MKPGVSSVENPLKSRITWEKAAKNGVFEVLRRSGAVTLPRLPAPVSASACGTALFAFENP